MYAPTLFFTLFLVYLHCRVENEGHVQQAPRGGPPAHGPPVDGRWPDHPSPLLSSCQAGQRLFHIRGTYVGTCVLTHACHGELCNSKCVKDF